MAEKQAIVEALAQLDAAIEDAMPGFDRDAAASGESGGDEGGALVTVLIKSAHADPLTVTVNGRLRCRIPANKPTQIDRAWLPALEASDADYTIE